MVITQTVDIPASRRLTIDVPREVPTGPAILIFEPIKTLSHVPNATTMAALQETSDIMSGKKKVKWNRFETGISKTEAREKLKKTLGSR